MKQMIRAVTVVLLAGGWSLAASAVHVIRTPSNIAIVPKDRLTFHETWVDTRKWTLADDQAHPAVVARLVHLGRADLLKHTLAADGVGGDAALVAIAAQQPTPGVATSPVTGTLMQNAEGQMKQVVDLARDKAHKL
jgi:hypothetical protein